MCLRDKNDHFISVKIGWFHCLAQSEKAEARGLKEAISWLENRGLTEVSIELDYKQVIDNIFNHNGTNLELGAILNFCKASLSILF
jgi:ribonuclease HI